MFFSIVHYYNELAFTCSFACYIFISLGQNSFRIGWDDQTSNEGVDKKKELISAIQLYGIFIIYKISKRKRDNSFLWKIYCAFQYTLHQVRLTSNRIV